MVVEYASKKDEKIADFQRFSTFDTDIIYGGVPLHHQSHYATSDPMVQPNSHWTYNFQNVEILYQSIKYQVYSLFDLVT